MKKLISMVVMMMVLLSMTNAMAEGVVIISSPQQQIDAEQVDMSDIKLGKEINVEGYGIIKPVSCEFINYLATGATSGFNSGDEADYLVLVVEILNTQYKKVAFGQTAAVGASFGDGYEFGGWKRQYQSATSYRIVEKEETQYEIAPLYTGKYAFIVTLPNFVVESTDPLSMTVKLEEDIELTYHVRK